jgi:WD40 repeat protein
MIYLLLRKEPIAIEKKGASLNYRPHVNVSRSFIAVLNKMITRDYKKRYQTSALSPDGTLLASGHDDAIIKLWDVSKC